MHLYRDMSYSLSSTDHIGSCIVRDVCIDKLGKMKKWYLNNTKKPFNICCYYISVD